MGWLSSFLNPGKGYGKAQEQLDKYYQQGQAYLNPYNQQGQAQYGNLNDIIKNLMDPTALNQKWIDSYSTSPQALQDQNMAVEQGANAASALGLTGSNTALNATQAGATQIGLNDRQNYLNDMMNKYMNAAGLSQGIYGTGAGAATQMAGNANQMGQNSAQMAYNKQNAGGNMLAGLIGQGIGAFSGPVVNALVKRWNLSGGM